MQFKAKYLMQAAENATVVLKIQKCNSLHRNAWELGCVKDFQPCTSPWLRPTNVEFIRMGFFNYYSVLFLTKARLHVCVLTFSHLQKYSLCRLLSRFPKALGAHEALTLGSSITVAHKSCTCALQAYPAPKASSGRL